MLDENKKLMVNGFKLNFNSLGINLVMVGNSG